VQTVYEDVARDTNRGHTVKDTTDCFSFSKDAGYKIVSHLMPNLPNVPKKRDVAQFIEFFENPSFRSDGLKIYPTLVIRGTGLYELYRNRLYKNYSPDELVSLLSIILTYVPPFCRIYRIQRDIPMPLVSCGVEYGNLREVVKKRMGEMNEKVRDVRSREVGIVINNDSKFRLGCVSYEDVENVVLIGMIRVRKCEKDTFRNELVIENENDSKVYSKDDSKDDSKGYDIKGYDSKGYDMANNKGIDNNKDGKGYTNLIDDNTPILGPMIKRNPALYNNHISIIRELHVYGYAVPISSRDPSKFQHMGYGSLLIEEAERIAKEEHGVKKIAVISGVGTRNYYRKFGYVLEGPYMVKNL